MEPDLAFLYCVIGYALIILVVLGFLLLKDSTAGSRKAKLLRKQALVDYQNARGTQHLRLLKPIRTKLEPKLTHINQQLTSLEKHRQALKDKRDMQLRKAFEQHILSILPGEIPGRVYQGIWDSFIKNTYQGNLTDLCNPKFWWGLDEKQQAAIIERVNYHLSHKDEEMKAGFSGKDEVQAKYDPIIDNLSYTINNLEQEQTRLNHLLNQANQEIQLLEQIQPKHFEIALLHPNVNAEYLEHYLKGAFAEWEDMPKWFKELIDEANRNV
jgi:hypothetical protein